MTRLIDADSIPWLVEGVGEIPVITKEEIDQMPTVDAVPVVRCKDCKYYRWEIDMCDEPYSTAHNVVHEDDYCSRAERREE